jgi:hypothetical protein
LEGTTSGEVATLTTSEQKKFLEILCAQRFETVFFIILLYRKYIELNTKQLLYRKPHYTIKEKIQNRDNWKKSIPVHCRRDFVTTTTGGLEW